MTPKINKLKPEGYLLLLENSLRSIPFNILTAFLLSVDLWYMNVNSYLVLAWFVMITVLSSIRWYYSFLAVKKEYFINKLSSSRLIFLVLTLLMGGLWGLCYPLFSPHLSDVHQAIIILILGGMAAGSVASLSVYLPAYFVYILPMFLPIIIYNYAFLTLEHSILATMFLLFVVMVAIMAKMNHTLIHRIFQLGNQKDSLIDELSSSNRQLEAYNKEIQVMSITDSLTGLHNRRYFDNTLPHELSAAKRNQYPLGLLLVDIDNFKYINDHFGHPHGDDFLIFVASVLKRSMRRSSDILVRLGGDEFAAILANMDITEVRALSTTIKQNFTEENKHPNVTLSIGIICIEPNNNADLKHIVSVADKMLYQAKEQGKDQIISQLI